MSGVTERNVENQKRGEKGEALITASLKLSGLWNHKILNAGFGTPFDKLIIAPGGIAYAVEIKLRRCKSIPYSGIEENQRKGLNKFMEMVGKEHAFIIGIWQSDETIRAFLIPWKRVYMEVCSGTKGSINMLEFPELKKIKGGWDLSCFLRKVIT
jgi:hypothetical protein